MKPAKYLAHNKYQWLIWLLPWRTVNLLYDLNFELVISPQVHIFIKRPICIGKKAQTLEKIPKPVS
jgi:hypothetical protein